MSYVVLARKYRPQTFSELTGQEHVSRTLQNAIDTGRVAHAFLFTGARGVGKTSTARILARTLNCERGVNHEPCNLCPACTEITKGTSTDVFEIDGASNAKVEEIRDLLETARYLPSHSRYKIFIIDEVHMLSNSAFNALLKTLEEPPEHVKFIFATTEPHKLPVTILSRCQRFDFKRVPVSKIIARLREIADKEHVVITDFALTLIARKGDGSMRDSITAFDQVLAFCDSTVVDEDVANLIGTVDPRLLGDLSGAVFNGDAQGVLALVKRVDMVGYSMRQFSQELVEHFRNLLVIRSVKKPEEILDLADAELAELRQQAGNLSVTDIQRRLTLFIKAESEMAHATFPRLILEIALLKAAALVPVIPLQELFEKVRNLEAGSVHTPSLPWGVSKNANGVSAPQQQKEEPHRTTIKPPRMDYLGVAESAPDVRPQPQGGYSAWEKFVNYCVGKRVAVGSVLEHGSPLKMEPGNMEIGFPSGHYLNMAKDADFLASVKTLAGEFSGQETMVRIKEIVPETVGNPETLAEKKNNSHEQKMDELREEVAMHPLVTEAQRVFGATITEVHEA